MTAEPQPFDWPAALDAFGIGYTLDACRRVRDLLDAAGVPQPPLYHLELDQVTELRRQATARTKQADAIEQRAPRSTVNPVNRITDERDRFDVTAFDQEKPTYIDGGRITLRRIHDDT